MLCLPCIFTDSKCMMHEAFLCGFLHEKMLTNRVTVKLLRTSVQHAWKP